MDLYRKLMYTTDNYIDRSSWVGNLRWYAVRIDDGYRFDLIADKGDPFTLTAFHPQIGRVTETSYFADGMTAHGAEANYSLFMPWTERAAWVVSDTDVIFDGDFTEKDGLWHLPGRPHLFLRGEAEKQGKTLLVSGNAVLTWDYDEEKAEAYARSFDEEKANRDSAAFWNEYLASCPIVDVGDYGPYDAETIRTRQLWAWQVALKNISLLEENRFSCFAAPDKPNWFGVWSNDGAETLAALSLTSAAPLAGRALVEYADTAVTPDGIQSWYTHSDGTGCYGNPGDSGLYSHGVPSWVHAVDFYLRATGDTALLDKPLRTGGTLWNRIRTYLDTYLAHRDSNGDGLIEWTNLWETGWDDKVGPFFSKASLGEWVDAVTRGTEASIRDFYAENSCPVTPMVEQVYWLWALDGGIHMAEIKAEPDTAARYRAMADRARKGVREKMWNERDGFYHDVDVKHGTLTPTKNADTFYWLYYETDADRARRIMAKVNDPKAFGTKCLPMCSLDSEGFRPDGYWCGGHWPREMSYVSLGMSRAGYAEEGKRLLIQAICSAEGNRMLEVINPLTGKQSTSPNNLAYCVLNNVALLDLYGKVRWTDRKG